MSVNGTNAGADGATVKSTVRDGSKQCRSVGGDDLVQNEHVQNKRQRVHLLLLRGEVNGWY
jgi:hypothetical protein